LLEAAVDQSVCALVALNRVKTSLPVLS